MPSPEPLERGVAPADLERLRDIVTLAYRDRDGATRLNDDIVFPRLDFSLFAEFNPNRGTRYLVGELLTRAEADEREWPILVTALMEKLPGNTALREWVALHAPDRLGAVSDQAYRVAMLADAGEGLGVLQALAADPEIGGMLARSRSNIARVTEEVARVKFYKDLHDKLHNVQMILFESIVRSLPRFPADELAATELGGYADQLKEFAVDVCDLVDQPPDGTSAAGEAAWAGKLDAIAQSFSLAVRAREPAGARRATLELKMLLRAQPPRLNALLVRAAQAIPLGELISAMTLTAGKLAQGAPERLTLLQAAAALTQLGAELSQRVAEHQAWQQVEVSFWETGDLIARNDNEWCDSFSALWPVLASQVAQICGGDVRPDWAADLLSSGDRFLELCPQPVTPPVDPGAPFAFSRYVRAGRSRFYILDKELKSRCGSVAQLSKPLGDLVGSM